MKTAMMVMLEEGKKQEEGEEGEKKKYEKWPCDTFEFYQLGNLSLGYLLSIMCWCKYGPVVLVWQWEMCSMFLPSLQRLASDTTENNTILHYLTTKFFIIQKRVFLRCFT